jgi:DNA-binding PadR family transcriptional regulator
MMRLSPVSYTVLGLIGLRGPSTPYELKSAAARSIAYFWPFPHSQLYSEPTRLAEAGLLVETRESGGRNRKIYSLTDEGRRALTDWLAKPPTDIHELRDMALLQLQFFEFATEEALVELARQQVALHRARLATYQEIGVRYAGRYGGKRRMAGLRFGVLMEQAFIAFWDEIAQSPPAP